MIAIAIDAVAAVLGLVRVIGVGLFGLAHSSTPTAARANARLAAATNALIRAGSLTPGALSTPEETSTPGAPLSAMAAATLSGSSPPDKSHGTDGRNSRVRRQSNGRPLPPGSMASFGGLASISRMSATPS